MNYFLLRHYRLPTNVTRVILHASQPSFVLVDSVIQKYSTFNQIQGRSATTLRRRIPLPNSGRDFTRQQINASRASDGGQVSGFAEPPFANLRHKEALQKSQAVATRKPVARAVPSVRVGECKRGTKVDQRRRRFMCRRLEKPAISAMRRAVGQLRLSKRRDTSMITRAMR